MTEQATETLPPQQFQDEMHEAQFNVLEKMIVSRNDLVGRFNAASGDRVTLTDQIRENSTDPAIVEAREEWSAAYLKLMALVDPLVTEIITNSQGSQDEIENDIKTLDSKLKPGVTYFKKMYGENAAKYFSSQERVKGAIRAGGSGKRVRGFDVTVTIDGEDRTFDNTAGAAKHIGGDIETSTLQKAFFDKAGVDASKDAPDTVSFTVSFDEVDSDGNKTEKEAFVKFTRVNAGATATGDEPDDEEPTPEDLDNTEGPDENDLSQF